MAVCIWFSILSFNVYLKHLFVNRYNTIERERSYYGLRQRERRTETDRQRNEIERRVILGSEREKCYSGLREIKRQMDRQTEKYRSDEKVRDWDNCYR